MPRSRSHRFAGALVALLTVLTVFLSATASEPAPGPFADTWARTDLPVQQGEVSRTWIWAPSAFTDVVMEPYAESPGGSRAVQYFDKSRMELTNPDGDPTSPWHVTNGLLVLEMVEGYVQTGDASSRPRDPSSLPIAGDLDGSTAPAYADIAGMTAIASGVEGTAITRRFDGQDVFTDDQSLAVHAVTEGPSAAEFGQDHRTASVFWEFMTSSGVVWNGSAFVDERLFLNPYYATGLPIAPPFWATVKVGGTAKDVLIQCFERRCLTYTPDNAPGWQVEAGNVGLHYHAWRFSPDEPTQTPTEAFIPTVPASPTDQPTQPENSPTTTATSTLPPAATATSTTTAIPTQGAPTAIVTASATSSATSTLAPTATIVPTAIPTATAPSDGGSAAACLNGIESAFLSLINQYRADNGLGPLTVTHSLNVASYNHSVDMSVNNYFSHTSQNGDSPWDRMAAAGYDYNTHKGENIARGYPSAQAVFDGWRNSDGHNENMLSSNFNAIGIGYTGDGHYWTTDFGGFVDAAPSC